MLVRSLHAHGGKTTRASGSRIDRRGKNCSDACLPPPLQLQKRNPADQHRPARGTGTLKPRHWDLSQIFIVPLTTQHNTHTQLPGQGLASASSYLRIGALRSTAPSGRCRLPPEALDEPWSRLVLGDAVPEGACAPVPPGEHLIIQVVNSIGLRADISI